MTRTGVYVDDYLEFCSSLPSELQRLLSTMRELDDRSQNMMVQTREQVRACLMKKRDGSDSDSALDMQRQQIENKQTNTLKLCTEKVLLAQQAYDLAVPAPPRCYHCGVESSNNSFQYFDNKKADQPRYRCTHCRKLFMLGWHGRSQGKTYAKKRNEDPEELKSLSRQCRHCGVADNAAFKYYNNNNLLQPRFKCLSCGKQFQMRLVGTWEERHLMHTSSQQRSAPRPRHRKQNQGQSVPEPFPFPYTSSSSSSSNFSSSCEEGIYQPVDDGSLMPIPSDWDWDSVLSLETTSTGLQFPAEKSDEEDDAGFANFLEAELAEEETSTLAAYFTCWPGNENGSFMQAQAPSGPLVPVETSAEVQFPADMSDEDVLLQLLAEAEGLIGCND